MVVTNIQQLDTLAELAADKVHSELDEFIQTTPSLKNTVQKEGLTSYIGNELGSELSSDAAKTIASPVCSSLGNTVGTGVGAFGGGTLGSAFGPAGMLTGTMVGMQLGRIVTTKVCNSTTSALGKYIWEKNQATAIVQEITQAKRNLSLSYDRAKNNALSNLLQGQSPEAQRYLTYQFNRNFTLQPSYALLDPNRKSEIKIAQENYRNSVLQDPPVFKSFVDQSERIDRVTHPYLERMSAIMEQQYPNTPVSPKAAAENNAFLKEWHAENTPLDNSTQHQINALLHAQKQYDKDMSAVPKQLETLEKHYQDQLARQVVQAKYQGIETGFNLISQIGANSHTLSTIGSVGASLTSIAYNAALISGTTPGSQALSGCGLIDPYAAIGLAGFSIIQGVFGKKKNKQQEDAFRALSQQIEQFKREVHQWMTELSDSVTKVVHDLHEALEISHSVLNTALIDGFNAQSLTLSDIQSDLNRLSTIMQQGIAANYLQPFTDAISEIEQYTENKADRTQEIEKLLMKLVTWLSEITHLENTNGSWCLPSDLTAENVFSPKKLRDHHQLLRGQNEMQLGYLAKVISLVPSITFNEVIPKSLPNTILFQRGVESYVQGRLHIGTHAAQIMDPDNNSLNKILESVQNGLRFLEQLTAQEAKLLSSVLSQYEETYQQLKTTLIDAARSRLKTKTVPGLEFSMRAPLNAATITWPTEMTSRTNGFNALPFKQTLLDAVKAQNTPFPKAVQAALNAGVGKIVAYYTHSGTGAYAKSDGGNWNYSHWIQGRTVNFNKIEIGYELNGMYYALYTTSSSSYNEGELARTPYWKHKNPGEFDNTNQQKANLLNQTDQTKFVENAWSTVAINAITEVSSQPIPENLETAMIDSLVNTCIIKHTENSQERVLLIQDILQHPEVLHGLHQDLSVLKALLSQFGALVNTSLTSAINSLWDKETFIQQATNYQTLAPVILTLKTAIEALPANTSRSSNSLVQQLNYCDHLLNAVKHHESIRTFAVNAKLSDTLHVDEKVVFNPQLLNCEQTPENELGSGTFGTVYKATDHQTGAQLAVKILHPGRKLMDAARGELEVISRLTQAHALSSNLVQMFGVTQLNKRESIVMEYVPNGTLESHLYESQSSLSVEDRYKIASGLIAGLSSLHEQNIIHGDLKSVNVLLTENYEPKIADYGLARVAADTQSTVTTSQSSKTLAGTLAYMAPEMFTDETATGHPTKPSDVYALGVLLWQILTNKKPFTELNGNFATIALYWIRGALKDHFQIPDVPPESESARFHRFFKPMITECRSIAPENRPIASTLVTQLNNY